MLVERKTHFAEYAWNHFCAHKIVVVEGPPGFVIPPFAGRLTNVVEQCGPSEPLIIAFCRHIVEHLQGVQKVVFMRTSVHRFHPLQGCQFRENVL